MIKSLKKSVGRFQLGKLKISPNHPTIIPSRAGIVSAWGSTWKVAGTESFINSPGRHQFRADTGNSSFSLDLRSLSPPLCSGCTNDCHHWSWVLKAFDVPGNILKLNSAQFSNSLSRDVSHTPLQINLGSGQRHRGSSKDRTHSVQWLPSPWCCYFVQLKLWSILQVCHTHTTPYTPHDMRV